MEDNNINDLTVWFCGFYEAEGTISKYGSSLYQNDVTPLEIAKDIWGGKIKVIVKKSPASEKICVNHELRFVKNETIKFISEIMPYMRTPRKIANIDNFNHKFDIIPKDTLTDDELNKYFAGFYEGDGWAVTDKSNNNCLIVGIDQQTIEPLNLAKNKWGGTIIERIRKSPASEKMCTIFTWRIMRDKAIKFIDDIKPNMLIPYKINQIKNVIENIGNRDTEYKCKHCEATFNAASNRRRHEREYHERVEKYSCEYCETKYKNEQTLKLHIKNKHADKI